MHSTTNDYNAPVAADDVAGQIQRVADRRHQGNRLVVPPVTVYGPGLHFVGGNVWFVSNTYPPVEGEIVGHSSKEVGDITTRRTVHSFDVKITGTGHTFYRTGEIIGRVSSAQLRHRYKGDGVVEESAVWNADHTLG